MSIETCLEHTQLVVLEEREIEEREKLILIAIQKNSACGNKKFSEQN